MSYQQSNQLTEIEDGYQSAVKTKQQSSSDNNFLSFTNKKYHLTVTYFFCFWNFGICIAIFGSTLLDLACQTSSSLSSMTFLYFLQNFMSLIGCFLSGILVNNKKIEINDLIMISSLIMSICVAFMSFANHILLLGLLMIILGFNMGCIDNLANLAILKLHVGNVSPFMQAMHFFYGIGAFLTPVIVNIFLNKNLDFTTTSGMLKCYNIDDSSMIKHPTESAFFLNKSNESFSNFQIKKNEFSSQTKYAFWILALIQLPAPAIIFYIKKSNQNLDNYTDIEDQSQENNHSKFYDSLIKIENVKKFIYNNPFLQLIVLISIIVFLFEGLQAIHGGFIYSYTMEKFEIDKFKYSSIKSASHKLIVNRHHSHHIDNAYITAGFWAFFSIGRLVSIYLATKISSLSMLTIDIIGCLVACLVMILSSTFSSLLMLYIATCLLGLFLSNMTPTIFSLAEIQIGMTATISTLVIICAASGEMIFPLIVAYFFENSGSNSFIAIELLISIAASVTFVRLFFVTKSGNSLKDNQIWLNTSNSNDVDLMEKKSNNMCYSKMQEDDSD